MGQTKQQIAIAIATKNNKIGQGYYERHFAKSELEKIAKGQSAGEVYEHVIGNNVVTPEQRAKATLALKKREPHHFGKYDVKCDCGGDKNCKRCHGKGTNEWGSTV